MKVLTAAQMRCVDRRTIERGISGLILMENAAHRVVELLRDRFAPLATQRIVVLCGKGNNGGDGLAIARQLQTQWRPQTLDTVLVAEPEQLQGDAAENYRMLLACGALVHRELSPQMQAATLVIDALLGSGLQGPARGDALEAIRQINAGFPLAKVVAVDVPSGMNSDHGDSEGEVARADYTVTFTAPKWCHVLGPNCYRLGELHIGQIGSPEALYNDVWLTLSKPHQWLHLLKPRDRDSNKGRYGHVLVLGGSRGKTGAPAMTGLSALRMGAGLVTVSSVESAINVIAGHAAELMTEPLPEAPDGSLAPSALSTLEKHVLKGKTVLAVGPGLGTHPDTVALVQSLMNSLPVPVVVDADGLNALAGTGFRASGKLRVLTPHPGEMARLCGTSVKEVQADRVNIARQFAQERTVILVLKGDRTVIAHPDGRIWINPTGSPAMATGGTGDILTGFVAGMLAQFPDRPEQAVHAAVWLHGRAGERAAQHWGEQPMIATDLLAALPESIRDAAALSHPNS